MDGNYFLLLKFSVRPFGLTVTLYYNIPTFTTPSIYISLYLSCQFDS
jgi:hypothetical protein